MRRYLKKMKIDEDREWNLLNLAKLKKNKRIIETDHNGLLLKMEPWGWKIYSREGRDFLFKK